MGRPGRLPSPPLNSPFAGRSPGPLYVYCGQTPHLFFSYTLQPPVLPPGLSLNTNTGLITGTPLIAGTYNDITVNVYDPDGGSASITFSWTISGSGCPAVQALGNPGFDNGPIAAQGGSVRGRSHPQLSDCALRDLVLVLAGGWPYPPRDDRGGLFGGVGGQFG